MLDFLELEETVGKFWHRLVGSTTSMPRYPEYAVSFDQLKPILACCFRGFGGEATVQVSPAHARTSTHRLRLRQLIGVGEEKVTQASRDLATVLLPPVIDLFPDRSLNRDLYIWLVAAMAAMIRRDCDGSDRLALDLQRIAAAQMMVKTVLATLPGLRPVYQRLCAAILKERRRGALPAVEQLVENRIVSHLRRGAGLPDDKPPAIFLRSAPPGYQPMMGVPLWPEFRSRAEVKSNGEDIASERVDGDATQGNARYTATRQHEDERRSERSPFILNRFEKILAMAEMVNVDRPTDDGEGNDRIAADDLDDVTLGRRKERPSSKFRFDLDLPPEMVDPAGITAEIGYPEWDYRKGQYLDNYTRVLTASATATGERGVQSDETRILIRKVRRQFEILRPRQEILKAQLDGADLDLDALVRSKADFAAGGQGSDRIYLTSRSRTPDLATTILVDVSLSTDAWIDNRRVLDVEKEALLVLAQGLEACGSTHSILTFTSRRRSWVRLETVKRFSETVDGAVEDRIAGLKPGYYTRMGAAIRHAAAELHKQPSRRKLLLVLTDGKPNDIDHYEGRFALEDSRRAVQEVRRCATSVFAVTVDRDANSYLPMLFGRNGFAMVGEISKLPVALPRIYRGLTA
ncbi:nitric oxide reductase activation protein NorD [Rhizobium leguminosarum]|uniref:nitric oxide reductase activation protein NorD n=1 Tax=Rhizobium leguminosarum TaxID=384 RepID=UPI00143F693C|nr:VWA domain-containing protein [Rhizobium leguminosarum]NKL21134.1 VWA domain-containing protein [Rhizobium leguminosarum bv. viciae]NKL56842.1 VWA domain-containing protein [Rhizobium leguminosarum bv. viciae]